MTPSGENNESIVEALRDAFAPVIERLTPEIEPATVFVFSSDEDGKDE